MADTHPEVIALLEELVNHMPVSPSDKAHFLARVDGIRDPEAAAARMAAREAERQAAIQKQIDELQAQLAPAKPRNIRGG